MLVIAIVHAIVQKVHQVRHHGLRALGFQQIHQMVIGQGHVFDQNLAHHADARFAQSLVNGKIVKGFHNAAANCLI